MDEARELVKDLTYTELIHLSNKIEERLREIKEIDSSKAKPVKK